MISAGSSGAVISLSCTLLFAREIEGSASAAVAPRLPSLPLGPRPRRKIDYSTEAAVGTPKRSREANSVPLPARAYTVARDWVQATREGSVFDGESKLGVTVDELMSREARK